MRKSPVPARSEPELTWSCVPQLRGEAEESRNVVLALERSTVLDVTFPLQFK